VLIFLLSSASGETFDQVFNLPPLPPPEEYGNILINRVSVSKGIKPVTFSHWQHRRKYTCRVCHTELEFNMKVNTTEITETDNKSGRYCGACHNGVIAFRHTANCGKCHNGDIAYAAGRFSEFQTRPFPTTSYGNGINWVESLREKMITPANFLRRRAHDMSFDKTLILESEWSIIPPSIFPHRAHIEWLECSSCHPEIFNIKKKTTKNFSMSAILDGKFCGICHLNVAFPMNDCKRCHPGVNE
jgi:c(7)-type cytochrome triheme protein